MSRTEIVPDADAAVAGVADGATVLIGGFGPAAGRLVGVRRAVPAGRIELELVPQGTLAERLRAAGAGIGAFFCPTGAGTPLAEGKEARTIDGREHVLEFPIKGDVALIKAHRADTAGNLVYRKTARNFGPVMAAAAAVTVAQVDEIVEAGDMDPEVVVTPGIYVDRVVRVPSLPVAGDRA